MYCFTFLFHRITQLIVVASILLLLQGKGTFSFDIVSSSSSKRHCNNEFAHFQQQRKDLLRQNTTASSELCDGDNNNYSVSNQRRSVFAAILSVPFSLIIPTRPSSAAVAATATGYKNVEKKPFAPLENLLPAVRVKLSIDSAISLTKSIVAEIGEKKSATPTTKAST